MVFTNTISVSRQLKKKDELARYDNVNIIICIIVVIDKE